MSLLSWTRPLEFIASTFKGISSGGPGLSYARKERERERGKQRKEKIKEKAISATRLKVWERESERLGTKVQEK